MRVIKQGEMLEFEITCDNCFSQLAYTKWDEMIKYDAYDGDLHDATFIICPVCGKKVFTTFDGTRRV